MHPKMMIALGNEVETERRRERQRIEQAFLARAGRHLDRRGSVLARERARRLITGLTLRPRVS